MVEKLKSHPIMGVLDGCMNTRSGLKLDILNPTVEQIHIQDIAAGLAFNSHFSGQTPKFFSIAQHCCMVTDSVPDNLKRIALLHDASEAYLGDVIKPLKVLLPDFQKIEAKLMKVIFPKYGLDYEKLEDIKPADNYIQGLEFATFYLEVDSNIDYWEPDFAYRTFLNYCKRLF